MVGQEWIRSRSSSIIRFPKRSLSFFGMHRFYLIHHTIHPSDCLRSINRKDGLSQWPNTMQCVSGSMNHVAIFWGSLMTKVFGRRHLSFMSPIMAGYSVLHRSKCLWVGDLNMLHVRSSHRMKAEFAPRLWCVGLAMFGKEKSKPWYQASISRRQF